MPSDTTNSLPLPFQGELKTFFFDQMEGRTSAVLYGSGVTGNWVAARSDLDMLVLVSRDQIERLGEIIRRWKATPGYPILDGFALVTSGNGSVTIHLEDFCRVTYPNDSKIQPIDLWNIKYSSKPLFGTDFVKEFPDIGLVDLVEWARKELRGYFVSSHSTDVPRVDLVLSKLIWSVSWSARLLVLARGVVCASEKEALQWLAKEYIEIREPVGLLLSDFYKSDTEPISITSDQSETLRRFLKKVLTLESAQ